MVDIFAIKMEQGTDERDNITLRVEPADLYPVMVERVKEALATYQMLAEEQQGVVDMADVAPESIAPLHRGGDARANTLMKKALALPAEAWVLALEDRDTFYPGIPYSPRELPPWADDLWEKVKIRGDALEVCLGWFLHAMRVKLGGFHGTIGRDLRYRL